MPSDTIDPRPADTEMDNPEAGNEPRAVPYRRFKEVNDKYRATLAELEALRAGSRSPEGGSNPPAPPKSDQDDTDWQAKYEAERATRRNLELARLRDRTAQIKGIPLELADKLTGSTEEEIMAEADRLLPFLSVGKKTAPNLNGDKGGSLPGFTVDQLRDPDFFHHHQQAIYQALREGRISD